MQEPMSYEYMGPKSASVVMGWYPKRNGFTVDVHIYRIAGLWGWRPEKSDARINAVTSGCCRAERVEVHAALSDRPAWSGVSGSQGRSSENCDLRGSEEDSAEEEMRTALLCVNYQCTSTV
jgi:hypothetical protein